METRKTLEEKRAAKAAYMREYWKRNPEKYAAFLARQVATKASRRTYQRNKDKPEFQEKKKAAAARYAVNQKTKPGWEERRIRKANRDGARHYNLPVDEYVARKDRDCEICGGRTPRGGHGGWQHIDHCHDTGKLRGTLCASCNRRLGYCNDELEWMEEAVEYLRRWKLKHAEEK